MSVTKEIDRISNEVYDQVNTAMNFIIQKELEYSDLGDINNSKLYEDVKNKVINKFIQK
tara:strand:- start:408 stop:584 length:177 start_codon:yes stop_codon:yes gene_type:complete